MNNKTKMLSNSRVIVKDSEKPGKKVLIMVGVHGNEVCGVKALDELIPTISPVQGKVTFIYANLEAIKQNKRFIDYNLNRCFIKDLPKNLEGTLEGKTSRELIPYLEENDILLDLHSSKTSANQRYLICEKHCESYAFVLSPKKVIVNIDITQPGGSDGFMHEKIGICIECGLHEAKESIDVAKEAVLNVLKKAEIIEGTPEKYSPKEFFTANYIYKNKKGPFELSRDFKDFEEFKEKTLVGKDGDKEVFAEPGEVIMFVDNPDEIGKECFLILKKE